MDLAAEFRWSLLPPLTMSTPRVRIAGMLEPAYEIAGDAFDYAVNGDIAHVAMFDAVGHGLRACQLANLAVAAYRNCRRSGYDLTDTAVAIDAALTEQFGESWFVTALLAELDIDRGSLRWLTAGHPLPMLVRGGKVVATLESPPGMPLGLGGPAPAVSEVQLEPDDAIFCYSDGVTEARSVDGYFFGEERLADYLARAAADEFRTGRDGPTIGAAPVRAQPRPVARRRDDVARQLAQALTRAQPESLVSGRRIRRRIREETVVARRLGRARCVARQEGP